MVTLKLIVLALDPLGRRNAGRDARGRKNGEKGGRMPLGYERTSIGEIVVVPEQVEIVRQIFELRTKHYTMRAIADELNANNISTACWESKSYASSVKNVLDHKDA
ncbi:MAG: recombinase family protein [Aggregatilineales bacterium]